VIPNFANLPASLIAPRISGPAAQPWRRCVLLVGTLALLLVAFPGQAAGQTPAQQQYQGGVPEPGGGAGQPGIGGKAGGGKAGAGGKGKQQESEAARSGEEGRLTFADSDDDGGLSTVAIILIVLALIGAGTLAYWWWQERRAGSGPEPPAAGGPPAA
jgi:hypothetical protein